MMMVGRRAAGCYRLILAGLAQGTALGRSARPTVRLSPPGRGNCRIVGTAIEVGRNHRPPVVVCINVMAEGSEFFNRYCDKLGIELTEGPDSA